MATVEEALQTQIRNIEATYGRTMPEWFALIAASGLTKHTDVIAMLKREYAMTHGSANRVALLARDAAAPATGDDALYAGRKAALRPIHEALMRAVNSFGGDVEVA